MALPPTPNLERQLRNLLNSVQRPPNTEDEDKRPLLFGNRVPQVELWPLCKDDPIFQFVLRFFSGLSDYIQAYRDPKCEEKKDSPILSDIEILELPRDKKKDNVAFSTMSEFDQLFWTVIEENLRTGETIGSIIRRVDSYNNFQDLTECCEITLNLLRNYVICDYASNNELFESLEEESESNGMGFISEALPRQNWFLQSGTSTYLRTYSHLHRPTKLNQRLPGVSDCPYVHDYVRYYLQRILGQNVTFDIPGVRYGQLTPENAGLVLSELTRVITHVPNVIEDFWEGCNKLKVTAKFTFPPEDMTGRIVAAIDCTWDEARSLIERLGLVLKMFELKGLDWEKVPRVDLIGLALLMRIGLVTFISRELPDEKQLLTLFYIINSNGEFMDADAEWILSLILGDIYLKLNEACFKTKIELLASLVSYRVLFEKSWDTHTYLLRQDLFQHLRQYSPRFSNHKALITKLTSQLPTPARNKSRSYANENQKKLAAEIQRKISLVKKDWSDSVIGILVVLMEVNGYLRYVSKTYEGNSIQLLPPNHVCEIQGLSLEHEAASLYERIIAFLSACPNYFRGGKTRITLGLISTTCKAGGILAATANQISLGAGFRLFTLPDRILKFYGNEIESLDVTEILEAAWTCLFSNLGHLSLKLSNLRNTTASEYLTDWNFQLPTKGLPLQVLSTLLHVATTSNRIDVLRCFMDPSYSSCIQSLLQCSSSRMEEMNGVIHLVRNTFQDSMNREALLQHFSKTEVLMFLGLTTNEAQKYSLFFFWNEHYPLNNHLNKRRMYFNTMLREAEKFDLWERLKRSDPNKTVNRPLTYYEDAFVDNIYTQTNASFIQRNFIHDIQTRINSPNNYFRRTNKSGRAFVTFGTQTGEVFKNVDFYSFKCKSMLRFTVQHFPIRIYLEPLSACYPRDFPDDVKKYANDEDAPDEPNIVAKSQLFALCSLNKRFGICTSNPTTNNFIITPMFTKNVNSIIIDLQPPTSAHRYDVLTSLFNLTYLDKGRPERIAGRLIPIQKFGCAEDVPDEEFQRFRSEDLNAVETKFMTFILPRIEESRNIVIAMEKMEIPNLTQHFQFHNENVRLKLSILKLFGGFPGHLEVEYDKFYVEK